MGVVPAWEGMLRDLMRSCTHIVAVNEHCEELARCAIVERFFDGMPAPARFEMEIATMARKRNHVSMYLYNEKGAATEVDLYYPMIVGPGDSIRLDFKGCRASGG